MVPKSPLTCKDASAFLAASHVPSYPNVNMAPLSYGTYLLAHNNLCMRDCPRPRSERAIKKDGERAREGGSGSPSFLPSFLPRLELPFRQKVAPRPPTHRRSWTGGRASERPTCASRFPAATIRPTNHEPTDRPTNPRQSDAQRLIQIRHHAPRHDHGGRGKNRVPARQTERSRHRHSFRMSEKMTSLDSFISSFCTNSDEGRIRGKWRILLGCLVSSVSSRAWLGLNRFGSGAAAAA